VPEDDDLLTNKIIIHSISLRRLKESNVRVYALKSDDGPKEVFPISYSLYPKKVMEKDHTSETRI
jgi:hypothetical protein